MESGNGGASCKGVLIPVSDSSDVFQKSVLVPLQGAYLYEESKQFFRYKSAVLVKNPALEEKYDAFRAKRREVGYSEEDLKESYGFLLFDDVNKANALGETGVLAGNSTCTTLGDPSKGVYISMYSDCLDLNRWYHGKSGYIAIIRLTKGKVKKVLENYTQNFTAPTVRFDCHVSEQLPSVSSKTSSFLAFERTQYYMYELLDDGCNKTAQSPSAACPFAIVSFSYTDTKATLVVPQEKSEVKKLVCHYLPWRGQLQIGSQAYSVGLRLTAGAIIPTNLPPVVNVDQAISMLDLRHLLPRAVFETCFTGEAFLDGLYCSLCELVTSEAEQTSSLALLLWEMKEKDLALAVPLNDGGFLILLHSSHFLTYDDTGSSASEVLQGIFVFPDSRVTLRDIKFGQKNTAVSCEVLRCLPALSYAESEAAKTPIDPSEQLCEVLAQHMQSYAALINPGLALSPSREVSIFPDQYDVPDDHKHLYSSPEWSNREWQSFRSYLSKPASFQLPVSRASEILMAGQEERREDLDDDVYICLSSPEEAPSSPVGMGLEDQLSDQEFPVHVETCVDSGISSAEAPVDLTAMPENVVPDDLQAGDDTKDNGKRSDLTELNKTDDMGSKRLLAPTSDDLPAELIVSITSAEQSLTDETLRVVTTVSAPKHNDFQFSGFSTRTKLQTAEVNSLSDETDKTKKVLECSEITSLTKTKQRKLQRGRSKRPQKVSKAGVETCSSRTLITPVEVDEDEQAKESSDQSPLRNPSNWRKLHRRKRKFGKLASKNRKVRFATVGLAVAKEKKSDPGQQSLESTILMELDACPLRKKTERWDLKPVISESGRILVPYGSADIADQIKYLKDKLQSSKDEQCPEKMFLDAPVSAPVEAPVDAPVNAHDAIEMEQESAPETAVAETEATNFIVSHVNPELSILRQSDDGSCLVPLNPEIRVHSLKNDDTDIPSSQALMEKRTDILSPGKCPTKGEFLLSKLKSVLLRGKRKTDLLVTEETTANTVQDTEPCLKKGRVDSDIEALEGNNATTPGSNAGVEEVSKMLSVDPLFAYALGLTPKEMPDKVQKTEDHDIQQGKDSTDTQEHALSDKQFQIIQRPPSIFPRRGRIKTLKKHQGISAECIKKKWWLHFQTPACFASEKLKYKDCTRDKTVKEKMNSACSSTDALNLLADLALSASNDQVPPQPDPALERNPETSLKKCDLTKNLTSAERESVLHALLRQPAARSIQPLESPSPSHLVGDSELVDLVSQEHAYSLPPSSSLLLGLPGTPFQVSPVSGSTRLLHHHQTMYGDGIKTLHPSVDQEDRCEHDRTPEYLKKHMVLRQKFRHSRTFVNKEGSVQVTRQWQENYDFNRDSKFTSDSKDRAIIRALHGPWDFSIQDTSEEVRLIVHMWIGLFYSRSTARIFHVDSNFMSPSLEESDSLEMPSGVVSGPAKNELKASSFENTSDPLIPKALDLSKKDNTVLDQESVILDLSLRNFDVETVTSDPQVNRKETSASSEQEGTSETLNSLGSPAELHEPSAFQGYRKVVLSTEIISEVNDVRCTHESKKIGTPSQKAVCLEHTVVSPFKVDGTFIPVREEMESVSINPETAQVALGIGQVLHGCNKENADTADGTENSENTEMSLVQKDGMDLSQSVAEDSNKEVDYVIHTDEQDKTESQDRGSSEIKENPCQESNLVLSLKVIHTSDANKESDIVSNINCFENEKPLSREEPKAISQDQAENDSGDVDGCTRHDRKVSKGEDHFREEELHEKDGCISAAEVDKDLSDEPLPVMCDGPDLVKEDSITECNHPTQMDEQPPLADGTKDTCHDLQLTLCANGVAVTNESAISEKAPHTPSEVMPVYNDSAAEENSENLCLADKAHFKKLALSMPDEIACSLDGSSTGLSVPQTKDTVETENQNKEMSDFNVDLSIDYHEDQETKSTEGERDDNSCTQVVIPFIGIDTSGEYTIQPHDSHPQNKVEEVVPGKEEIPFISETTSPEAVTPNEVIGTTQVFRKQAELSSPKIPFLDESETNQLLVWGSESDNRCPTPTIDEKPYEYIPCSSPSSSTCAFRGSETCKNITQKCLSKSSTLINDKLPLEQKLCHTSTVNSDPSPHHGLHPDVEVRTLRVLQSIDKFLSKSNLSDKSSHIKTAATKKSQTSVPSSKHISTCLALSHTSADFKDKKISNEKPAVMSASTSQDLHPESDHFVIAPFKNKLEQVLGVKLQLKKTDSSIPQHYFERTDKQETSVGKDCHSYTSGPSTECLQVIKPNTDQERHRKTLQSSLNHEPRSYSQRPVMAVKPSKSEESQADCSFKDPHIENCYRNKQTKTPVVTYTTPTSMLLEKKTKEPLMGNCERLRDKREASELSSKSTWLPNASHSKSNSDAAKYALLDPSYQYQGKDLSKFNMVPSTSLSVQTFESATSSPELVDGNQGFLMHSFVEKDEQTTKENIEMNHKDCSETSASFMAHKDNSITDDSLILRPQTSLICTVYNTNWKRPHSFLEQVSQRCLQADLTQVSMEQECLIFSEQMKRLVKKSKRGPIHRQDTHDNLTLSCASPVTVHFSGLEEQDDSGDDLDMSLVGQKFKVDMSNRKDRTDTTKEEKTLHPQELSQGAGNPVEHAGVSGVTAECARLYEVTMHDICTVKKVPSKCKGFRMDRGYPTTESSNHFDFCDQMKRELDETFRSNLNSVVKKSCKTKYRFYILVTSDDVFFKETKAQLEAEGHTSVQPSEFFVEDSSSSLLIILRNEDIAEHICEVPHLLELKKSPGVLFAGIDEPDDVVNLTHQELFTRGGFIMFDRAALEPLSLCNMKKMSEILQELNRMGKWKWMLHYRDSRRLKENARLSAEEKEKKHFLYWGQDAGILEVLPYHECDLMSRDQPDYLTCLVRLQVQNVSSRYPVFITDTTTDGAFERSGILTMTLNSFLTKPQSETFTV